MKVIDINGKQYVLKLTLNALIKCEKIMGRKLGELGEKTSIEDLRTIYHVAFEAGGAKHDIEKTGELLDDLVEKEGMDKLSELLTELINKFLGKSKSTTGLKQVTK